MFRKPFRARRLLAFILSFALILSNVSLAYSVESVYTDVPTTNSFYIPVSYLSEVGVLGGYEDGSFGVYNGINRAESLAVIFRAAGIEAGASGASASYSDVATDAWFYTYVAEATSRGIVGGNPDGSFAPGNGVTKAAYIKMLLEAFGIKDEALNSVSGSTADVTTSDWFYNYMMYAYTMGLIIPDSSGNLNPGKELSRGEVAEITYLLVLILGQQDTQFLIDRASAHMTQITVFVDAGDVYSAKDNSELAVDITQQAYNNMPSDTVVLGVAKLAKSWDYIMDSFLYALSGDNENAELWANYGIEKATDAWAVNPDNAEVQQSAATIKTVARTILEQVGGEEWAQ